MRRRCGRGVPGRLAAEHGIHQDAAGLAWTRRVHEGQRPHHVQHRDHRGLGKPGGHRQGGRTGPRLLPAHRFRHARDDRALGREGVARLLPGAGRSSVTTRQERPAKEKAMSEVAAVPTSTKATTWTRAMVLRLLWSGWAASVPVALLAT